MIPEHVLPYPCAIRCKLVALRLAAVRALLAWAVACWDCCFWPEACRNSALVLRLVSLARWTGSTEGLSGVQFPFRLCITVHFREL